MDQAQIFLQFDEDSILALESNQVSIADELAIDNIHVTDIKQGTLNEEGTGDERTKDILTILIASAAVVAAVGYALSAVITSLNNKPKTVVIDCMEEVRDNTGNIVFGADGKPVFKTVKKFEVVNPAKNARTSFDLELFKFFKISIKSE